MSKDEKGKTNKKEPLAMNNQTTTFNKERMPFMSQRQQMSSRPLNTKQKAVIIKNLLDNSVPELKNYLTSSNPYLMNHHPFFTGNLGGEDTLDKFIKEKTKPDSLRIPPLQQPHEQQGQPLDESKSLEETLKLRIKEVKKGSIIERILLQEIQELQERQSQQQATSNLREGFKFNIPTDTLPFDDSMVLDKEGKLQEGTTNKKKPILHEQKVLQKAGKEIAGQNQPSQKQRLFGTVKGNGPKSDFKSDCYKRITGEVGIQPETQEVIKNSPELFKGLRNISQTIGDSVQKNSSDAQGRTTLQKLDKSKNSTSKILKRGGGVGISG